MCYFRPTEAKQKFDWVPKITLDEMVKDMVEQDIKITERGALCEQEGYRRNRYYE